MTVQINQKFVEADSNIRTKSGGLIMVTPPIDEDYWLFRVPVSDKQAVVGFPKFGTIGIGFQKEDDWNTNLPYQCSTDKIFNHIKHNKGDESIPDDSVLAAILEIQIAAKELLGRED